MAQSWYYSRGGTQYGPIGANELKQLADAGGLSADDLVWKDGASQWAKASTIRGLLSGAHPSRSDFTQRSASADGSGGVHVVPSITTSTIIRRRTAFPALGILAHVFTGLGILSAIVGGGVLLVTAIKFASREEIPQGNELAVMIGLPLLGVLGLAAVAVFYLAAAEGIRLALYVATLLEDIREKK